jgi:hypothetical protein
MLNVKHTAQELEGMLKDIVLNSGIFVPIGKDLIKYKKYTIIKLADNTWSVFYNDVRKKHIATTFLKVSAFAICKLHEKRQAVRVSEIEFQDKIFEKNYVDSLVFKHTYKNTKDNTTRDTALWRFEIAHAKAKHAKEIIDGLFYTSLT